MQNDSGLISLIGALNEPQKEAVTAPPEHRLVLAGAGSGKTRVLTHRIAWLIEAENISPHSILAVTFTNKAAAEMRGRIEELVRVPVRTMWVGTFHGIAHRMLRLHWREAGLPQNFQIIDSDDQLRLVRRVLRGLDLPEDRWPPRQVTNFINARKDEGQRSGTIPDLGDYTQQQMVRIYTQYEAQCRAAGLVDFAELLLRAFEICRDNAEIKAHYRRRFRHILVDEFQDTNSLQYNWLRELAGTDGILFGVGDDDQSIYGWRGAKVENMLRLDRDFPGTEIIRLEQNYRSTGTILKAANGLIEKNAGRLGKNLWTDSGDGAPIQLYAAFNEYDEADFVVGQIKSQLDGACRYRDLAVLYRSNAQSRVLEEALIRNRIPYRIYGGLRFFERMEVKDALAYLRLIAHRDDDAGFERAVNTPPRGIGNTTLERMRMLAREQGVSMWQVAKVAGAALGRSAGKVHEFTDLIDHLAAAVAEKSLFDAMEAAIEHSGLRDHYKREKGDQAEARLENLDELVSAARTFQMSPEDGDMDPLSAFVAHAALEAGEQQAGAGDDAVQMMTLHSAKGLEFRVVFLVGLENGLFPHQRAIDDGSLEEERRLCYVGITRARRQLYLSHAETRRIHGVEQLASPSKFLREMPGECIVETRPRINMQRPAYSGRRGNDEFSGAAKSSDGSGRPDPRTRISEPTADYGGFRLGERVNHAKFGEGTILSFDGDGDRTRVEIRFAESGTKHLMLSYAKLQAV